MKKIITALALVLSFAWTVPATAQGIKFGVVGGLNLTKMNFSSGSDNLNSDNRCGWYFGPKMNISLPLGIGLDAAVEYNQRRLNINESEDGVKYEDGETFRSIEIPVNLRYNFGLGSIASVYVSTGPQFGFAVGNSKMWDGMFKSERMNTSWNIGAGAKLMNHLELGIGYNFAMTKWAKAIVPESWQGEGNGYNFKANTFQVQVAYLF